MAKIILKSRYLQAGSRQHSEHLIHYIAKREGVQKIDDTWKHQPTTGEQKKLIEELVRYFPDTKNSFEYADFLAKPSKGTTSEFISRALMTMWLCSASVKIMFRISLNALVRSVMTHTVYLRMRMFRPISLRLQRKLRITTAMYGRDKTNERKHSADTSATRISKA